MTKKQLQEAIFAAILLLRQKRCMQNILLKLIIAGSFLLLFPSLSLAASCSSLTGNIGAYYEMQGNGNDATGNSHTLTATSILYSNSYGKILEGANFVSSSNSALLASSALITGSSDFSVGFWINTASATDGLQIISQRTSTNAGEWGISIYSTGFLKFFDYNGGYGFNFTPVTVTAINNSAWHYVVFTRLGTTGTFYVDGSSNAVGTAGSEISYSSSNDFALGYDSNGDTTANMDLDEVGVWSCALTSAQDTTLYNGGAGLQYPFTPPTVSHPTEICLGGYCFFQ